MVDTLIRQLSLANVVTGLPCQAITVTAHTNQQKDLNRIVLTFHVWIFIVPEDGFSCFGGFENHNR